MSDKTLLNDVFVNDSWTDEEAGAEMTRRASSLAKTGKELALAEEAYEAARDRVQRARDENSHAHRLVVDFLEVWTMVLKDEDKVAKRALLQEAIGNGTPSAVAGGNL